MVEVLYVIMQNSSFQLLKGEKKCLQIEHEGWKSILKLSDHSKEIKKCNLKSAMNRITYRKKVLTIVNQNVNQDMSKIQEETTRKDVMMEEIQTQSENLASHGPSITTKSEEIMSKMEIECLDQRAQTYVSLIIPDPDYIKTSFDRGIEDDWPPHDKNGFVIVTKEDNMWRREFEHQERLPEGTILVRPQVKMTILIALIVSQSPDKMLKSCHVYEAIQHRFPYFLYTPTKQRTSWKKSVRHILADKKWFSKVKLPGHKLELVGSYWTFNINWAMPENWNLSAQSLRTAIKPCLLGSSRETNYLAGSKTLRDLLPNRRLKGQTENSCINSRHIGNSSLSHNNKNAPAEAELATNYQIWKNYSAFSESCIETPFIPNTSPKFEDEIVSRPESCSTTIWEIYLPNMPNLEQIHSQVIACELPFESSDHLTEI